MAGPAVAGIGKVSAQVSKEALEKVSKTATDVGKFEQVLQNTQNAATAQTQQVAETTKVAAANTNFSVQSVKNLLNSVIEGQHKVDKVMDLALKGKDFSPQELLLFQTSMYSFVQELELTSKVVEQATSGIKTTMQTQV